MYGPDRMSRAAYRVVPAWPDGAPRCSRGVPEELQRECEELERERRELDPRPEANKEEQERVLGDIEEIPQPRDRSLRSLLSAAEELGSGHMAKDG